MSGNLAFIHRFEPGNRLEAPPLLLLHGTGGDENDLLPLGRAVSPGSTLLSPRGQVLERGMPRFFRRLAEGIFDEADVRRRAHELADFVQAARAQYGIGAPVALGFSNGANIAAATLLLRPDVLAGAVLLRAMVPLAQTPAVDLGGKPVLIVSGKTDPIVPTGHAGQLATLLSKANADVTSEMLPVGHHLTQADVTIANGWMRAARFQERRDVVESARRSG
ncbi:MAG: alpha/beta hydrolase [Beijerinckiaceae bacterium]|nr:alpha/beta hydrolase [Beijerinckiaceae bacterium]